MTNLYANGAAMSRGTPFTLVASAVETASTHHAAVDTGDEGGSLFFTVDVTAVAGSGTLVGAVEGSQDGTTWVTLAKVGSTGYVAGSSETAPTAFSASGSASGYVPRGQFVRFSSTITGTSVTYSVTAVAC